MELVRPLMDFDDEENPPKIMYNNDWLSKMNFEDILGLASNFTVQQMIERDMFQKRLAERKTIYLHELLYPLMQGYDSVAMEVDVELGGTDQTFNALAGRTLLKKLKNKEKFVVVVTLMENPKTGELMSKSKGIGVFLNSTPNDMYGQIMSQPDEMIEILFTHCTLLTLDEIANYMKSENPRDTKMKLALEITQIFYGSQKAEEAQEYFVETIQKKNAPQEIPELKVDKTRSNIIDLLVQSKLVSSRSDAKRVLEQDGVKVDGEVVRDDNLEIDIKGGGVVLQKGKRHFIRIVV
jgi:tyrosyl-tRNA synthetase